jgi:putative aldouronate transport system substrate-binding protein
MRTAGAALWIMLMTGCFSEHKDNSDLTPNGSNLATGLPLTLTYWVNIPNDAVRSLKNFGESLFYQELDRRTGVHIEFLHPPAGTEAEQFNLMIASRKLPDMIESNYTVYPGGPEKALDDKVIIPLNDLINEHAPNLKRYLDDHPQMKKEIMTDNGTYYAFPALGIGNTNVNSGLMLRKDWLDELGLALPETIDEWTHVLRQFKEKKGASSPLTLVTGDVTSDRFTGAYGISSGFYMEQGKVRYGPYEPAYRMYLEQLNAWYKEGLLDADFAIQDARSQDAKIMNGQSGAFVAYVGSGMGKYLNEMKGMPYNLSAAQHPVLHKGEEPRFFPASYDYRGDGSVGITPANKHPGETARWLDYYYSQEGHMLKSFGIEGQTYVMENGYPRYTGLIMNNPDRLSVGEALSKYLRVAQPSPGFVGDERYSEQYSRYDQQKEAAVIYNKYYKNLAETRLPRITETPEEGQEVAAIMSDIAAYSNEMILKFITGVEPFSRFDEFILELKDMGIERAIDLKQTALDRYNNRE